MTNNGELPRVLIIGTLPYNPNESSRALDSYFHNWPNSKLRMIQSNSNQPYNCFCESHFRITDIELLRKLFNKNKKIGRIFDSRNIAQNANDEIYFAALTTDVKGKNQPVIVGRGHLVGFTEENYVKDEWVKDNAWMTRYPWYCVIKDSKILDMPIEKGIPMDEIWDKLGSDTYISSFGKNESIADVAKKHHQKAHIRLSGNAKEYIDKRLNELEKQYGVIEYNSNI